MVKCGGWWSVRCSCLLWLEESFRSHLARRTNRKTTSCGNRRCWTWLACQLLADRHKMTVVNGTMSTSAKLFAGVPQGVPALLNMHEWHSFSKVNKSVCGWHFILCDRQCSQLVRIKAPGADQLPFNLVCQVASDCKSNKICSDGFSFKKDAGRNHPHNSRLTPSTTVIASPGSWSDLLRHIGLDKPRRHRCKSNFGQS